MTRQILDIKNPFQKQTFSNTTQGKELKKRRARPSQLQETAKREAKEVAEVEEAQEVPADLEKTAETEMTGETAAT